MDINTKQIKEVLNDDSTSYWLKDAILSAMKLDPVDAAIDAEILFKLLDERCKKILK